MPTIITEHPQFFTATILEWKRLLKPEKYKDVIIRSLQFLVENNRIRVNSFAIMDNHIHLIWQMMAGINPGAVQRDFMKYTPAVVGVSANNFAKYLLTSIIKYAVGETPTAAVEIL